MLAREGIVGPEHDKPDLSVQIASGTHVVEGKVVTNRHPPGRHIIECD
jgi:hypothetical protein